MGTGVGNGCGMNKTYASSPDCMSTFSCEIGSKIRDNDLEEKSEWHRHMADT